MTKEYGIQVRFEANGNWIQQDTNTFSTITDAKHRMKYLQSEHAINKMYLPTGYKNEYTEFRIVERQIGEWKPIPN